MVAIIKDPVSEKYGVFCFSSLKMKMMLPLIMGLVLSLSAPPALAETKTFIKEYTHRAGDEDSRNSSRTIALGEVKRLLLEELGTYLESQTEVKNFQMTKDQITTLTAGIVSAEPIEDTWDGKVYWLKAKIATNPQEMIKSIDNLRKDREKVKELEELRKKVEELLKELKIAKGGSKQEAAQAYKRNIDNLSATEWFEKGYQYTLNNQHDKAIEAYTLCIDLNPNDFKVYNDRGYAYYQKGQYDLAIEDYNKAISINANEPLPYNNRGIAYYQKGQIDRAIEDYNKAISP